MSEGSEQAAKTQPTADLDPRSTVEAVTASGDGDEVDREGTADLQSRISALESELADQRDKHLRALAEMENYKKRTERLYADQAKSKRKDLLVRLLGVMDNLERALHYGEAPQASGESIMEGVRLTQYQLDQLLAQEGVRPIQAEGKPFDPYQEEAIQSVNDPNVPDHTVIQVVRTGYTFGDEVLRPAQVIVSVHSDEEERAP